MDTLLTDAELKQLEDEPLTYEEMGQKWAYYKRMAAAQECKTKRDIADKGLAIIEAELAGRKLGAIEQFLEQLRCEASDG